MTEIVDTSQGKHTSRRVVLGGMAAVGAGAVLAACGGKDEASQSSPGGAMTANPETAGGAGPGTAAGAASAVPVGGAVLSDAAKVVISQPKAGEFKAFDWTCTHKGCPVKKIEGDVAVCPCHGSHFSVLDGSVKKGPATTGLTPVKVVEKDGNLFIQG